MGETQGRRMQKVLFLRPIWALAARPRTEEIDAKKKADGCGLVEGMFWKDHAGSTGPGPKINKAYCAVQPNRSNVVPSLYLFVIVVFGRSLIDLSIFEG